MEPNQETICIRTTKVYDWCTKHGTTYLHFTDLALPGEAARLAGVECDVIDLICGEVERRQISGGVAVVTLRKQVTLAFTFIDSDGAPLAADVEGTTEVTQFRTRFWDEFVRICAPDDAEVTTEVTECSCRTKLTANESGHLVEVELFDCQSIESAKEIKVLVDIVDVGAPGTAESVSTPFTLEPAAAPRKR